MNRSESFEAVVRELEKARSLCETDFANRTEEDPFVRGCYYGYMDGMKRAIDIVYLEIGIRERPQ
jgi:hypothetical protein